MIANRPSMMNGAIFALALSGAVHAGQAPVEDRAIDMELGKGRLIRLETPATSIFVANSKIVDVQTRSPTLIYLLAKTPGRTTLTAINGREQILFNAEVNVHYAEAALREMLMRVIPTSQIDLTSMNNALVLTGTVRSAADALVAKNIARRFVASDNEIVNAIAVEAANQVSLRVRVVEVSRDIIKALGFNWGSSATPGQFSFGLSSGFNPSGTIPSGVFPLHQGNVDNILAAFHNGTTDLNVAIDALDSEGLVTVLAEPNLTAISGAPASFLAGGEYPIPVPQGLNTITIEYKRYGVSLAFVATITEGNRINLQVKPEVSELSSNGAVTLNGVVVPALTTRRAETTVDLASGQSFAIAGLMQNNVTHDLRRTPGLGNLPGLGALFRSDRFERHETELMVIVTPYLVRPSRERLSVPTDGYIAPTDPARVLNGADYTRQKQKPRDPGFRRRLMP